MGMYIGKQLGSLWELALALMLPIYIFINMKTIILIICILITCFKLSYYNKYKSYLRHD